MWESLNSGDIEPLMRLFPDGVWDPDNKARLIHVLYFRRLLMLKFQKFLRPPSPQDWGRFTANARRVKTLTLVNSTLSDSACTVLSLYAPAKPLLPNLRCLKWVDNRAHEVVFCCSQLFLSTKLQKLEIYHGNGTFLTCSERLVSLLDTVRHIHPPLKHLVIKNGCDDGPQEFCDAVSRLVCALDLEACETNLNVVMSKDAIMHLAKSRSLKTVSLWLRPCLSRRLNDIGCFPAARKIHVDMYTLGDSSGNPILHKVVSPDLEDLTIAIEQDECPTADIAHRLFSGLAQLPDPLRMRTLRFDHKPWLHFGMSGLLPAPGLPQYVFDTQVLEPLFCMRHLTHLQITHVCLDVTDELTRHVVKHFPALETLYLLPGYYSGQHPNATLNSLAIVATGLACLRELGMRFRPVALTDDMTCTPGTPRNRSCVKIEVGDSPLSSAQATPTALFISLCFGNRDLKLAANRSVEGMREHDAERALSLAAWKECEGLLPMLCTARDQERARLAVKNPTMIPL